MTKAETISTLPNGHSRFMRSSNRRGGFSLLELLIVVAIILIIATIAIPSLLRSRQSANESGAVAALRIVNTAQITYMQSNGGIFGSFTDLVAGSFLLDPRFLGTNPTVGGYTYTMNLFSGNRDYSAEATPAATSTGRFDYYTALDGVVRHRTNLGGRTPGAPVQ